MAAAASTPYGGRAARGSGGLSSTCRTASRASGVPRSSGRYAASTSASAASVVGGSSTPIRAPTWAIWATYSSRPAWSSGRRP